MLSEELYKDFRGEIIVYKIDGFKFNVLTTKKGMYRGGESHPVAQYTLVLKGKVEVTLRQNDEDVVIEIGSNELIVIPSNIPHLFKSLTDTVMIHWYDGDSKSNWYEPYRKLVFE